jgi:hypothetical protein
VPRGLFFLNIIPAFQLGAIHMDTDSVKTIGALALRRAFTILGAWLAAKGLIAGDPSGFVGACMVIAEVLYEAWSRYGTVLVNAQLAKLRGVHPSQVASRIAKSPASPPASVVALAIATAAIGLALAFPELARAQTKAGPSPSATAAKQLTATQVQQNPLLLLQSFTVSDLQAALADANAQTPPDAAAAACYTALLAVVQSNVANPVPAGPGLFQALQKARDAKALIANLQSPTGPLAALNNSCAPLLLDAQNTLLGLGVSVGLVANPVSAPIAIAGVPGAVAAFLAALPK